RCRRRIAPFLPLPEWWRPSSNASSSPPIPSPAEAAWFYPNGRRAFMALQAAAWPRNEKKEAALLVVERENGSIEAKTLAELPLLLKEGDLLILNDAATLPASFT